MHDLLLRRVDLAGLDGRELVYGTTWIRARADFLSERKHRGVAYVLDSVALLLEEERRERRENAVNAPFKGVHPEAHRGA